MKRTPGDLESKVLQPNIARGIGVQVSRCAHGIYMNKFMHKYLNIIKTINKCLRGSIPSLPLELGGGGGVGGWVVGSLSAKYF